MKCNHDEKCYELATYFLADLNVTEDQRSDLADDIQKAVEDWINAAEPLPREEPRGSK